eukprot:TRINITY_DN72272_c0_g1_i1.p1 TRINITY_DN72272_c0_g1~~TRINITY_DN72272_c0_g1_i1.p1  ORF type:complete len:324 (-),score=41.77 TRINITY_DN72272_c0_g1_i1:172-1008(-)
MNWNGFLSALLLIVATVITFFGGMLFNIAAWNALAKGLYGYEIELKGAVPAFLMYAVVISLAISADSPLPQYMRMTASPELHHVSVCDWPAWDTSEGGVYFQDGSLFRAGVDVGGMVAQIHHCKRFKGSWESCRVGVRPIFRCDSSLGKCADGPPCAWAVNPDGFIPAAVPCGEKDAGGICGFAFSFHASPEGMSEMSAQIKNASKVLHVGYSDNTPLVRLANPDAVKDDLHVYYVVWWVFMILYTVAPAISLCIFSKEVEGRELQSTDSDHSYINLE